MLATIVLNELEMLPKLVEQHRDWPGLIGWCIVEGSTKIYGKTHPDAVTKKGLSTDGTSAFLKQWRSESPTNFYIDYGWSDGPEGQQKRELRNTYCCVADIEDPDLLIVIDADEAYTKEDQERILQVVEQRNNYNAWLFKQRHIWRPPSADEDKIGLWEVVGGYWDIPHTRVWRWQKYSRYVENHNYLNPPCRTQVEAQLYRYKDGDPECVHFGFARSGQHRARTNAYYKARGEGREKLGRNRQMYVDCRDAFETWQQGDGLPHGARVRAFDGVLPEVWE